MPTQDETPHSHESDPGSVERVADLTAAVADVASMPLADQVVAYQRIHTDLQGALADIDGA